MVEGETPIFLDNTLSFNTSWAVASAQAITTTADSSTVVDVTGAGSGNAPAVINSFPGTSYQSLFNDYGVAGDGVAVPWIIVCVQVAPTSTTNTLTVALKGAPDAGSGYTAGTYDIYGQTDAMAGALLLVGSIIAFPMPPRKLGKSMPRFYKLTYTASATLTPMTVLAGIAINPNSWLQNANQINSNFIAA